MFFLFGYPLRYVVYKIPASYGAKYHNPSNCSGNRYQGITRSKGQKKKDGSRTRTRS